MTCAEFTGLDDVERPKIVYWAEGFNKNGQPLNASVDVGNTDRLIPMLVVECKRTPAVSLIKKMADLSLKIEATKDSSQTSAAPRPTKLTCEDFLALDDVVRPNVVYWTEGFSKKGKPVDSVVDVDETDELVPALVDECKAAPNTTA